MAIASWDKIKSGWVTDIYFKRSLKILKEKGLDKTMVRIEAHVYGLPRGWGWAVFAGLEDALRLFEGRMVNIYSVPEGTIFRSTEPILVVEGPVGEILDLETAFLGILRHASSIATKAARIKKLAGDRTVVFFGLRAAHPAIGPMLDRSAFIGGCDAVSGAYSEELLGVKPIGTMPHALIIVFGDQVKAWSAFDELVEPDVPRIMLVDTFYDERVESLMAAQLLGERLYGVRLDTPSSRRGNMRMIVKEVRWVLDLNGYKHVKIFVSGGIDEEEIIKLRDIVNGFGVGTSIAFPPSIDISMDIVEVMRDGKWIPISKRGKLPGFKQLYRCQSDLEDHVLPWGSEAPVCKDGSKAKPMLEQYMVNGEIVRDLPSPREIRKYVLDQLEKVEI
ncbi:nicotinate phosphoribosyltransferase [Desulfurococcaceae archaeon AG1]|nr:nicotinate phosphoribosyltransferase [Desulfurococcaceae archaeon AG1]